MDAKLVDPHGGLQVSKFKSSARQLAALSPLSFLLLAAIGAKLIDAQVGKWAVHDLLLPDSYSYSRTPTATPRLLLSDSSSSTPTQRPLHLIYTTSALLF